MQLGNLSGDCLIEILTLLNINDLTSVADCSRRFRSSARRAFCIKYQNYFLVDANTTPRIFRKFGDLMRFIELHKSYVLDERNVALMNDYAPNIIGIKFEYMDLISWEKLVPNLRFILHHGWRNLTTKHLDYLRNHSSLVALKIMLMNFDQIFNTINVATLKYASFILGDIIDRTTFTRFAMNHPRLCSLELAMQHFQQTEKILYISGFKYLTNLQAIMISLGVHSERYKAALKQTYDNVHTELSTLKKLRSIHLFSNTVYDLRKIKHLTRLKIDQYWKHPDFMYYTGSPTYKTFLKHISEHMPNITHLYVEYTSDDKHERQRNHLEFIRRSPKLKGYRIHSSDLTPHFYQEIGNMCQNQRRRLSIVNHTDGLIDIKRIKDLGDLYVKYMDYVEIRPFIEDFSILQKYKCRSKKGSLNIEDWSFL